MSTSTHVWCLSVRSSGQITHEGAAMLHHREGHLDGLQPPSKIHILKDVLFATRKPHEGMNY
jgi:hypothetical protein